MGGLEKTHQITKPNTTTHTHKNTHGLHFFGANIEIKIALLGRELILVGKLL